jgi:hypothetical protein
LPARSGLSQALVSRPAPNFCLVRVRLTKRKEQLRLHILRRRQEHDRSSKTWRRRTSDEHVHRMCSPQSAINNE